MKARQFKTAFFDDEDEKHRVKMGRLNEEETRHAEQMFDGSDYGRAIKSFLMGSGNRPLPVKASRIIKDGKAPFHFNYQCRSKERRVPVPSGRSFFEMPVGHTLRKGSSVTRHRNLYREGGIGHILSVSKNAAFPQNAKRVTDVKGKVVGIPRGAAARFATDYLVRPGAVEVWEGNLLTVASEDALQHGFWMEIERQEERRDARIQTRIIAELPYEKEIGGEGRKRILEQFEEVFKERSLPYVGVVHIPDKGGDQRNFHMHFVFHDRPYIAIEGQHLWAKDKDPFFRDRSVFKQLRTRYSEIVNAEYERQGLSRRLHPGSYAELGVEKEPDRHLGTKASALSRQGTQILDEDFNRLRWHDHNVEQVEKTSAKKVAALKLELSGSSFADDLTFLDRVVPPTVRMRMRPLREQLGKLVDAYDDWTASELEDIEHEVKVKRWRYLLDSLPKSFIETMAPTLTEDETSDAASFLSERLRDSVKAYGLLKEKTAKNASSRKKKLAGALKTFREMVVAETEGLKTDQTALDLMGVEAPRLFSKLDEIVETLEKDLMNIAGAADTVSANQITRDRKLKKHKLKSDSSSVNKVNKVKRRQSLT